jgi:hypothetical protein
MVTKPTGFGKTLCADRVKAEERFGDNWRFKISVDKPLFHTQLNHAILPAFKQALTGVIICIRV